MQLSELTAKTIRSGKYVRGVCRGVGISLKSQTVKYLLCSSLPAQNGTTLPSSASEGADFAVSVSAIEDVTDDSVVLSRLRAAFPKNCVKIFIGRPVYSDEGVFLGNVTDLDLHGMIAVKLYTDKNTSHSLLSVAACSDAVILRKEPPFPLGQRIPAPVVSRFFDKNDVVVTKPVLRSAIENGQLVRLTLSLPPFDVAPIDFPQKRHRFF